MKSRKFWVAAIFLFVVGDGLVLQTRGPLLRSFEADFGVSEGLLGLVAPAGTVGFVVAVLFVGFLAGRVDLKRWIAGGILVTVLSLVLMSAAPVYGIFLLFLLGQGTAAGVVRGLDRPILSHLYPHQRGRVFVLHSLAWSVGALLGPVYINQVLAVANWRVAYALLGLFFLPLFGLLWRLELPSDVAAEHELSMGAFRELLRRPIVLGMVIALTVVGMVEGILFTWLPFYASGFIPRDQANLLLSLLLLAHIPGRLVYSYVVDRHVSALPLGLALSVCAVPAIFVMFSGVTGGLLYLAVALTGFFSSGMFPLISTFGVNAAPRFSGPITAMGIAGAYGGLAVGPVMIGLGAEVFGLQRTIVVTAALAAVTSVTLGLTWLIDRRFAR